MRAVWRLGLALGACLLFALPARAGLAPLVREGKQAGLDRKTRLLLVEDHLVMSLRPEFGEWVQTFKLQNPGPAQKALLGVPRADRPENGPQDVSVRLLGPAAARPAPAVSVLPARGAPGVEAWLAFEVPLGAGESLELEVRAWQRHGAEERYGVWRLTQAEALWTASAWAAAPARLSRRVEFAPGVFHVGTEPESRAVEEAGGGDWERLARLLEWSERRPEPEATFRAYFWVREGARSACPGRAWDAVDGDARTRWAPAECPGGPPSLELLTLCRGFGLGEPDCTAAPHPAQVAAALVVAPEAKGGARVQLEGWFGPRQVWSSTGKLNQPLWLMRSEPLTVLRLVFPDGVPAGGAELNLLRVDLERSSPGAERVFARGARPRTERSCGFRVRLVNPFWFRHATIKLKPKVEPRDWMLELDCAEGRGRELLVEPEGHSQFTREQFEQALSDDLVQKWKEQVDKLEREGHGHGHHHGHEFRRKNPNRIELAADPGCKTWLLVLTTALPYCQLGPRMPDVPELELGF
jgi:hypothetical protein